MPDNEDKPDDKPKHSFKTDDELMKVVHKRSEKLVKEAAEKARREVLALLEVDDVSDIDAIKAKIAEGAGALDETSKVKSEFSKLQKEHAKLQKSAQEMASFRTKVKKGEAMLPHAKAFRAAADLDAYLGPRLMEDAEGNIIGSDGKTAVADVVKAVLDEHPHLRAPDFKAGAGTSTKPTPTNAPSGNGQPSRPMTVLEATRALADGLKSAPQ
jgi:hypothetical protein